ncbi:Sip1-related alpha-galactosidase [Robinsoniella peoriensis]|uniref:Sip1-related alpha-galactosidase n=1 Tax=Robinsoniella peoriensis TaxID=180332 RepID=UPI00362F0085
MKQDIIKILLKIRCQKSGEHVWECSGTSERDGEQIYLFEEDKGRAEITIRKHGEILAGFLSLKLGNQPFRENDNLELIEPVTLEIELAQKPRAVTAMYLHRDWWTRPEFTDDLGKIPDRTQSVFMEYDDGAGYLLPLSGNQFKAYAKGEKKGILSLTMTSYMAGMNQLYEPVFLMTTGKELYSAVNSAFDEAVKLKGIPGKEKKNYPDMFQYLGWCSWDAFYTDITEEKVQEKAKELKEKNVPVRWMLMDDGWLSVHDQRLYSMAPETEKFPRGFLEMTAEIKRNTDIKWFGVWHAFGGYWGGIEPGSPLAEEEKDNLFSTTNGKLLPYPEAERGYGFFRDWYEQLRRDGIDFVKVDGQSAVKNYYENNWPVPLAAAQTHMALEGAAAAYMGGRLINCMGMAMENILGRQGSAISRNSDDFVPDHEDGFKEHLLQNAYNALYHDELYYLDWDMFWTSHKDAGKHGLLRAISGGPVYFSDRIGETDGEAVRPLVYRDGRILKMDRGAKPSPDCIFTDPQKEGLCKLTNVGGCGENRKAGVIAAFNISPGCQKSTISPADIYDLKGDQFLVYDYFRQETMVMDREEKLEITVESEGTAFFLILPYQEDIIFFGLLDKYISFHSIMEVKHDTHMTMAVLRQGGKAAFYSEKNICRVLVNGKDQTNQLDHQGYMYQIDCMQEVGTVILMIETKDAL